MTALEISDFFFKHVFLGAGEMCRCLRTFAALVEDLVQFPASILWLTTLSIPAVPGRFDTLLF